MAKIKNEPTLVELEQRALAGEAVTVTEMEAALAREAAAAKIAELTEQRRAAERYQADVAELEKAYDEVLAQFAETGYDSTLTKYEKTIRKMIVEHWKTCSDAQRLFDRVRDRIRRLNSESLRLGLDPEIVIDGSRVFRGEVCFPFGQYHRHRYQIEETTQAAFKEIDRLVWQDRQTQKVAEIDPTIESQPENDNAAVGGSDDELLELPEELISASG